eukprot:gene6018-12131_t
MNFYLIIFVAYILSGDIASLKIIDTATSWRDLTQHEFSGWYSKTDRCILQHSRTVQKDPRRVKRDQCGSTDLLFDEKESGQLNVGYGYAGKICVPPLSDRRYFKKGLHNFTDPNAMYLVQALSAIYSSNRTLILLGDSMTGQTYDALLGEVARLPHISKLTRSNLSHNSLRNRILQSKGNYDQIQIKITGNIQLLEIFMIRINYINNIENSTFYEGNNINTWEKSKHLLYELIQEYNGIILLTNVGLWYNHRLTFSNEMKIYLNDLYNIANMSNKKNTVIWRESTASHFDRLPSGYYKYHDSHHMQCLPHEELILEGTGILLKLIVITTAGCRYYGNRSSHEEFCQNHVLTRVRVFMI